MKKYFHIFQEKRATSQQTKRLRNFQAMAPEHHDVQPFYRVIRLLPLHQVNSILRAVICCLVFGILTLISQCICGFSLICSLCCRYTWPPIFFDYLSNRTSHWNVSAVYKKFIFLYAQALWIKVKVGRITKNTVSLAQFTSGNLGC